jgi:hypothetical protein
VPRSSRDRPPAQGSPPFAYEGIPYLAPEFVLLFKAKATRDKDQADFEATAPLMTRRQRETLGALLERVHSGHPWLAAL